MSDEELVEVLKDVRKWTRTLAHDVLRDRLKKLSDKQKKIYELSTENQSRQDIVDEGPVSYGTIAKWQESWFQQGLMEKVSVPGGDRYVRIESLEGFGITVPNVEGDSDE